MTKFPNVTSEKQFHEPPLRESSMAFTFCEAAPGLWLARMEDGREHTVAHPDRATAYIMAAARVYRVPCPVVEEMP